MPKDPKQYCEHCGLSEQACECEFYESNQDPDLGGTGHGDVSYSDADPGL